MNISFAITVCNEAYELGRLLTQLKKCVVEGDEIVIQVDQPNCTEEVLDVINQAEALAEKLNKFNSKTIASLTKKFTSLSGDFSQFKNKAKKSCTKDYIYFIDADEEVNPEQIKLTRQIIEMNPDVDCYAVPRINTVKGLTEQHIQQWKWNVNDKGWVNFPDYQTRICKNTDSIQWINKVHEKLVGYNNLQALPPEPVLALGHHKLIEKQEKQNNFYNTI